MRVDHVFEQAGKFTVVRRQYTAAHNGTEQRLRVALEGGKCIGIEHRCAARLQHRQHARTGVWTDVRARTYQQPAVAAIGQQVLQVLGPGNRVHHHASQRGGVNQQSRFWRGHRGQARTHSGGCAGGHARRARGGPTAPDQRMSTAVFVAFMLQRGQGSCP